MFRTLTQEEQLSSTGFATLPSGGVLNPTGVAMGDVRPTELDWDTVVVGPDLSRTVVDPALLAAVGALDLTPHVPALGRPAPGSGWTPSQPITVLAEAPSTVVADAPVVGLVPAALSAPLSTRVAAAESVRQLAATGITAAVVEQWELT
jgi:hypothetical protein